MNASWPSGGSQLRQSDSDVIGGRYRIEHEIASGGMARVFWAIDQKLQRPVAVKILRDISADDQRVRERFQREANAVGRLNHEHIVALYDAGFDGATAYLVMPLIEGRTLAQELERRGTLGVREVVIVGRQIASALDHAHARGIVHGDIKPANILLASDRPVRHGRLDQPSDFRAMLLDFGVAQGIGEASHSGEVFGTAGYLAPERALGRLATAATDLYSFGLVLVEMLTGRSPSLADEPIARVRSGDDAPPELRALPAPLGDLVLQCLANDPRQRPSAAQLTAALFEIERRSAALTGRFAPRRDDTRRLAPASRLPLGCAGRALLLLPVLLLGGMIIAATVRERLAASPTSPPPQSGAATITIPAALPPSAGPTAAPAPPTAHPPESVRVPDIAGRSEREARRVLSEVGFRPATGVTRVNRRDLPSSLRGNCDGQVVATSPRAGTLARPGSEIQLTVCQPDNRGRQGNGQRNGDDD